jgi:stringent starvation protein B
MVETTSTKPYVLRAIYEWCVDNHYTPYIAVYVSKNLLVPQDFVKNDEIVLNLSFSATHGLKMTNTSINFSARFRGVAHKLVIPVENVLAIYAQENGQGMAFPVQREELAAASERDLETKPASPLSLVTSESCGQTDDPDPKPPAPPASPQTSVRKHHLRIVK